MCSICGADLFMIQSKEDLSATGAAPTDRTFVSDNVSTTSEIHKRAIERGSPPAITVNPTGTRATKREYLGDLVVNNYDGYGLRTGTISAHISQLLPLKAACDILAQHLKEKKEIMEKDPDYSLDDYLWISDSILKKDLLPKLSEIRLGLIRAENHTGVTRRGYRPSAGFPSHRDEDMPQMYQKGRIQGRRSKKSHHERSAIEAKSQKRFLATVFGGLTSGRGGSERKPQGALYQFGFVNFRSLVEDEYEIALTEKGAALAALENPLIHRSDLSTITRNDLLERFSKEESVWWWQFIQEIHQGGRKNVEADAINQVVEFLSEDLVLKRVDDLANHLAKTVDHVKKLSGKKGNPPPMKAYTSSLVNRWTSLNILERNQPGLYCLGPMYELLSKESDIETKIPKIRRRGRPDGMRKRFSRND
tara:strand:- start:1769 stop:3028 length:1260 start_codon:yes stop_codon:yes gene_type:complete